MVYVIFVRADALIRPRDDVGIVPYNYPLNNKHRIAKAEKAIFFFDRFGICFHDIFL